MPDFTQTEEAALHLHRADRVRAGGAGRPDGGSHLPVDLVSIVGAGMGSCLQTSPDPATVCLVLMVTRPNTRHRSANKGTFMLYFMNLSLGLIRMKLQR